MRFEMSRVGTFMKERSLNRGDIATDGAIRLMAKHGVAGVTLRSLADEFNCTPQAVRQWFGGTDQMWDQIAVRFGHRWVRSLRDPWRRDPDRSHGIGPGPHHLLPFDAEEIAATRAWLAITQLARDSEATGARIVEWETNEVEVIIDVLEGLDLDLDPVNVDFLTAVIRGLRHAVCATQQPMSLARAHEILARCLALLPESPSPRSAGDLVLF